VLTRRAIVEYAGGDFCQALADAKQAYSIQPSPCLLYRMGQIDRAMHHDEEAASELREYMQEATVLLCPGEPSALQNRSIIERLIEEMDEKKRRAQLAGHPGEPPTSLLHLRVTEPGAKEKLPQMVVTLTEAASREYAAGLLDGALENAQKAYAIQPTPELLYDLGVIHLALHHWEMAAFTFRAYLAASPRAPDRTAVAGLITQMDEANSSTPETAPTESLDPLPVPFEDPACTGQTPTDRGDQP
jgi:tetratricopeptide (TPR) repeat protein